jgi:allene oxide cyclase
MYRKLVATACASALLAVAIGGGAFASAASSGGGAEPQTITLIDKTVAQQFVDLGAKGFSVGDEFIFTSRLWNLARTQRLGVLHGVCTVDSTAGQGSAHCVGTAHLRGGTLEFAGEGSNGPVSVFAITGGTGRFIGARGQVTSRSLNAQDTISRDVIRLVG